MFSVNIDKIVNMTDNEKKCYDEVRETVKSELNGGKVLAVTRNGIGAFKIAYSFVSDGEKVLFIDADIMSEIFLGKYKLGKNLKGFTDYFQEDDAIHDLVCKTNRKNLDIIFTGETQEFDKADILDSEFSDFRDCLVEQYDYVIVHTGDNYDIAAKCDASVILLKQSDYSEMSAESKVDFLDSNGCFVLGLVVEE